MKHAVKKHKFQNGQDANQMLMKKLIVNFLRDGNITTTEKKAKALKTMMDRIIVKLRERKESHINFLLRYIPSRKKISDMYDTYSSLAEARIGGYTRLSRLHTRSSDGAMMCSLAWTDSKSTSKDTAPEKKTQKQEFTPKKEKNEQRTEKKEEKAEGPKKQKKGSTEDEETKKEPKKGNKKEE